MTSRKPLWTIVTVVSIALTAWGLTWAATDSVAAADPLNLHGYPPKTAHVVVSLHALGTHADADLRMDFVHDKVSGVMSVPQSPISLSLILSGSKAYVRNGASAGPWYVTPNANIPLYGLSLEMVKPDLRMLRRGAKEHVTESAGLTTHVYRPRSAVKNGASEVTIVTGSGGEVVSMNVTGRSQGYAVTMSVRVLSYNEPTVITTPQNALPVGPNALAPLFSGLSGLGAAGLVGA